MFFKKKCSKFDVDLKKEVKIAGKSFVFEIMPLEVVAGNSAHFDGNTCHRQPMC